MVVKATQRYPKNPEEIRVRHQIHGIRHDLKEVEIDLINI
jgi:hypothetical protein